MEKNKRSIIVGITGLLLVTLILLGLTYAYYRTRIIGNEANTSISIQSKNLEIVYNDNSYIIDSAGIEPGFTATKTFTVENTGDSEVSYGVYLENIINEFERKEDLEISLSCTSSIDSKTCNNMTSSNYPSDDQLLLMNSIDEDEIQTYTLNFEYLYLDDVNQSEDMGKTLSGKIQIYDMTFALTNEDTLAYQILYNAKNDGSTEFQNAPLTIPAQDSTNIQEQTLSTITQINLSSYKDNYWIYSSACKFDETSGYTLINPKIKKISDITLEDFGTVYDFLCLRRINGSSSSSIERTTNLKDVYLVTPYNISAMTYSYQEMAISPTDTSKESTLSVTKDDYGLSLYYRGDVTDNYMNYNGMCWRIVRIQGDGSIKLILESSTNECETSSTTFENAFIGTGFYGYDLDTTNQILSVNYLNPSYYPEKSIRTILNNWLSENNFDTNDLKKGDWCLGNIQDAYSTSYPYGKLDSAASSLITSKTKFNYDSYTRLYRNYPESSSLECLNSSKAEDDYIGTLTADEVVYAGLKSGFTNTTSYLTNYDYALSNNLWMTLTPAGYTYISGSGRYENQIYIVNGGYLSIIESRQDNSTGEVYDNIRPSIILNSNVKYLQGDGTKTNPYKIN